MKVLFVCTGNSFRSPVAEAILKKFRPDFTVESAGTEPARRIASNAKELLKKESAIDYLKKEPEGLESKNVEDYDVIVAMKEEHKESIAGRWPQVADRIMVWHITDPINLPVGHDRIIFEKIKRKVQKMANVR
jgi:protein-tyrosine-phosphatase